MGGANPTDQQAIQSVRVNGKAVVALINTNTSSSEKVTFD
jgi:hypothetical protein